MRIGILTRAGWEKYVSIPFTALRHELFVTRIRRRKVKVVFVVAILPMWRSEELFNLLSKDERFETHIVLMPFCEYHQDVQKRHISEMAAFFSERGIKYVDILSLPDPVGFLKKELNPDIIFYPQPYYGQFLKGLGPEDNKERLICYVPYATITVSKSWVFNQTFCNYAWRLYYPNNADLDEARRFADNKGKNVRIVGSLIADYLSNREFIDVWKDLGLSRKRIIWAPHHTIAGGRFSRSSFLVLHEWMLNYAKKMEDKVQFAFKPHPKLLPTLYNHPDWGKEKADAYYQKWAEGSNTLLVSGSYFDLFMSSDAMIHDCVSFTVEYLFSDNPVLFFSEDLESAKDGLSILGVDALDAHYKAATTSEIESFIENVVLRGNDNLKATREEVYKKYLRPEAGRSAAENIYEDLIKSLRFPL